MNYGTLLAKLDLYIKNNDFMKIEEVIKNLKEYNYGSDTFYIDIANKIVRKNLMSSYVIFNDSLYTAKNILLCVKNKELSKYKYVSGKINDYLDITSKDKYESELYFYFLRKGKKYYKKYDLEYAYYVFMLGYNILKMDIFLYYAGKIKYKMHHYNDALLLLNKYNETGSIRFLKSNLYIMNINKKMGNKILNNEIFNNIKELFSYDNFNIEAYRYIKADYKIKEYK